MEKNDSIDIRDKAIVLALKINNEIQELSERIREINEIEKELALKNAKLPTELLHQRIRCYASSATYSNVLIDYQKLFN